MYDAFDRAIFTSNPYFVTFEDNYTIPTYTTGINYSYDVLNRLIETTNKDGNASTATYDRWNITYTDESGNEIKHVLDAYGQIIEIYEYNGNETYKTIYTFNERGDLTNITDNENNKWHYEYDTLGRKTAMYDPDTGWTNYSYDANGNIISQTSSSGNLVTGDGYYRDYNELGQLVAVYEGADNSTLLEQYWYDHEGKRVKTYNAVENETTYTPFKEFMMVINSSGAYNYTYVYDGEVLVARINPDGSKWFYHPDHLGSTTLITNESGDVVEEMYYLPYGSVLGGGESEVRLYRGKEITGSDDYYFGASRK